LEFVTAECGEEIMKNFLLSTMTLMGAVLLVTAPVRTDEATSYKIAAEFEQVEQDAADVIINRGYVIDYTGYIGAMLNRKAGNVRAAKNSFPMPR